MFPIFAEENKEEGLIIFLSLAEFCVDGLLNYFPSSPSCGQLDASSLFFLLREEFWFLLLSLSPTVFSSFDFGCAVFGHFLHIFLFPLVVMWIWSFFFAPCFFQLCTNYAIDCWMSLSVKPSHKKIKINKTLKFRLFHKIWTHSNITSQNLDGIFSQGYLKTYVISCHISPLAYL